jgi:hypothetical protein
VAFHVVLQAQQAMRDAQRQRGDDPDEWVDEVLVRFKEVDHSGNNKRKGAMYCATAGVFQLKFSGLQGQREVRPST